MSKGENFNVQCVREMGGSRHPKKPCPWAPPCFFLLKSQSLKVWP